MDNHESKKQQTPADAPLHLHLHLRLRLQTLWSELTHRISKSPLPDDHHNSFRSLSSSLSSYLREKRNRYDNTPLRALIPCSVSSYFREKKKDAVLSTYEIKRRMHELPDYKVYFQTLWANFTHRIPEFPSYLPPSLYNSPLFSLSSSFSSYFRAHLRKKETKNNHSLSTREITRRMSGIPVYKISNYSLNSMVLISDTDDDRCVELCCMTKSDAEDLLSEYQDDNWTVYDFPLAHVIKEEGLLTPIRLVPEFSQIKNAIEPKNKDVRKKDMVDLSFSGVPVFQSDCLKLTDDRTEKTYSLGFFRKEDLDKHIDAFVTKSRDGIDIKVSSFEDIIQEMKKDSTSESNIVFVGPGCTSWTWHSYRL